jgi:hypothetical protein
MGNALGVRWHLIRRFLLGETANSPKFSTYSLGPVIVIGRDISQALPFAFRQQLVAEGLEHALQRNGRARTLGRINAARLRTHF